jgi:hypothetical protein
VRRHPPSIEALERFHTLRASARASIRIVISTGGTDPAERNVERAGRTP